VPLVATAPAVTVGNAVDPAVTAGTSTPSLGDCVSYSSETSMTGRSEPVQGVACRDATGKWQRLTEVPRPTNRAP
jgi:surface antigen